MKRFFAKTFSCLLILAFAPMALAAAEGEAAGWVGATGGMSVPNFSMSGSYPISATSRTAFGINGGAKIGTEFGVGAYYNTSRKDESSSGASLPFNYDLYGVMAGYFFEGEAKGVYLGFMLGMTKVVLGTAPGASFSTSPMHWGLIAGYDYLLARHFSLGGELNFVSVANSNGTGANGMTVSHDSFNTLNFNAAIKFWF